jgi:ABC-type transport system involved in cytochrome c biogenesis permease subunit
MTNTATAFNETSREPESFDHGLPDWVVQALAPLASLKLTVALFAMSIFIVLAGTLAQVDLDIWDVIEKYFRCTFAWIDLQIFFPPSFFPRNQFPWAANVPGGFWFPGGWLIGAVMSANLLAAHLIRFKVQSSGSRLVGGLIVLLLGLVMTVLVVQSGANENGLQTDSLIPYTALWQLFLAGMAVACGAAVYGWFQIPAANTVSRAVVGLTAIGLATLLGWLCSLGITTAPSDSSMRILWQLSKGGLAAGILLAGCWMVFRHRAGVVLLHGGIGLMMFGELLVGLTAVESQIQMQEGETVNFAQDIRTVELAVVDSSDPKKDLVTVIPKSLLEKAAETGKPIVDERLPFDVTVVKFLQNSQLDDRKSGDETPATAGQGLKWKVDEVAPSTGVDSNGRVDMSAAYVKLTGKDGADLGTYLTGIVFSAQNVTETVPVGDHKYNLALRFTRHYKPYQMTLNDIRKVDYIGTSTPKDYSSFVHLVDPSRSVDRPDVRIWMNNPLRFAGETFYQSSYHRDPTTGVEGTTLSVVTNTGWMIPYVSCMIVAVGMLTHFSLALMRFLNRMERSPAGAPQLSPELAARFGDRARPAAAPADKTPEKAGWLGIIVPAVAVVLSLSIVGRQLDQAVNSDKSTPADEYNWTRFGDIPVVMGGRTQPLDTLARNSLLAVSSRDYFVDEKEQRQPAVRWLADLMANPEAAFKHRVFRIENLELQQLLGLERRERFRYAPEEFLPKFGELTKQANLAREAPAESLNTFQKHVLQLEKKLGVLDLLLQSFSPPRIRSDGENTAKDMIEAIRRQEALAERQPPLIVPPSRKDEKWETFAGGWLRNIVTSTLTKDKTNPYTDQIRDILLAYAEEKPREFNNEVDRYLAVLGKERPDQVSLSKTDFEAFFNRFVPFTVAQILYITAFVLCAIGWLAWTKPMNRAAVAVTIVALAVHTFALVARMYISGRPPVTNLYSSAVFIGWGCVGLGLFLEAIYRNGIGVVGAVLAGAGTLYVAGTLATGDDTMSVLQAVLDTQFWLATHVTCITFGYSTTLLAAMLGALYVVRGVLTPSLTPAVGRDLTRMIYGTLCFSIFFSFVGTVLGGLWADDSWGRFWGWDPKENGALMIVLWNALILHARWGKMIKDRGLAVLSILGAGVVSWSWFGVNGLEVGLHSYGFDARMATLFVSVAAASIVLAAIGLVPRNWWWSGKGLV